MKQKKLDETKTGKFVGLLPTRPGHITYIFLCGMTSFELILNLVTYIIELFVFFIYVIKLSFNIFQESLIPLINYFRKIYLIFIKPGNAASIYHQDNFRLPVRNKKKVKLRLCLL